MGRKDKRQQIKELKKKYGRFFSPGIEILLSMASEYLKLPLGHLFVKYIEIDNKGKFLEDIRFMVDAVQKGEVDMENLVIETLGK